ncbi:MAG: protein kinase [Acidobacteria bacterium]|nr:protein kinase [Acidobacteriota bacterium]
MENDNTTGTLAESTPSTEYLGLLLKDRYLIERVLGKGGLGLVFLARDRQLLNRAVVIKVLVAERGDERYDTWFQKKFKQEMEALARINHPGVVGVLDTGAMPDGKPFLVMQFVEGNTLRAVMIPQGMDFDRVAAIVRQMGQALAAAHEKGVYHRDLKPENIMLEELGGGHQQVKLIDFGVARIKDSEVATDAEITWIAGTPPYMAPEQLRGRPTAESDIYGLGAVVYEMLTGRPPFKAGSAVDLYELQREGAITKPRELRGNLPEAAEAALLKALSFDAQDRYKTVLEFTDDLAATLTGVPRSVAVSVDPVATSLQFDKTTDAAAARETSLDETQIGVKESASPKSQPALNGKMWLLPVAAVALVGLVAYYVWNPAVNPKKPETKRSTVTPTEVPAFSYWVMVQKYRDGKTYQQPFRLAKELVFENDYHVQLNVSAARSGFLYIINEGPDLANGLPEYVTLFPSPTANNGSAELAAEKQIRIPEVGDGFFFDKDQGTEKVWLIWSSKSLAELEAVKLLANPKDKGLISDPAQIRSVRDLIAKSSSLPATVSQDETNKLTVVSGSADVLAHLIKLEHQ